MINFVKWFELFFLKKIYYYHDNLYNTTNNIFSRIAQYSPTYYIFKVFVSILQPTPKIEWDTKIKKWLQSNFICTLFYSWWMALLYFAGLFLLLLFITFTNYIKCINSKNNNKRVYIEEISLFDVKNRVMTVRDAILLIVIFTIS